MEALRLAARPRRWVRARCLMRRRRVAGGLRDLIAMIALRAVSHRLEGRRAGAKLALAIVIDLNALIGIGAG